MIAPTRTRATLRLGPLLGLTRGADAYAATSPGSGAGGEGLGDIISFPGGSERNRASSLLSAGEDGAGTVHGSAFQTRYGSGGGNFAAEEGGNAFAVATGPKAPGAKTTGSWY